MYYYDSDDGDDDNCIIMIVYVCILFSPHTLNYIDHYKWPFDDDIDISIYKNLDANQFRYDKL